MSERYRINFLSCYGGTYKVVNRCYLIDSNGDIVLPDGTMFSWSQNQFSSSINFNSGYIGTQQWHSWVLDCSTPFWGIVEFPAQQDVAGILWQATETEVHLRSPRDWSVERWDEAAAEWVVVREVYDEPQWAALEIRKYSLKTKEGRAIDLATSAPPRIVLFDWDQPSAFENALLQPDGRWESFLPPPPIDRLGIYYLGQKAQCPPIIHGPYIVE